MRLSSWLVALAAILVGVLSPSVSAGNFDIERYMKGKSLDATVVASGVSFAHEDGKLQLLDSWGVIDVVQFVEGDEMHFIGYSQESDTVIIGSVSATSLKPSAGGILITYDYYIGEELVGAGTITQLPNGTVVKKVCDCEDQITGSCIANDCLTAKKCQSGSTLVCKEIEEGPSTDEPTKNVAD